MLFVLFLGNSHTYYNTLATTLAAFPGGIVPTVIAVGGRSLQNHLDDPAVVAALRDGPGGGAVWDWVVMQPQSVEPMLQWPGGEGTSTVNKDLFLSAGAQLAELAVAGGAKNVLLYGVWPKASPWLGYALDAPDVGATPRDQARLLRAAYAELRARDQARLLRAAYAELRARVPFLRVAPVAEAWEAWAREHGDDLRLYQRFDWSHASPSGSYLAALALWRAITGGRCTQGFPPITGGPPPTVWPPGQPDITVTDWFARRAQCVVDALCPPFLPHTPAVAPVRGPSVRPLWNEKKSTERSVAPSNARKGAGQDVAHVVAASTLD